MYLTINNMCWPATSTSLLRVLASSSSSLLSISNIAGETHATLPCLKSYRNL